MKCHLYPPSYFFLFSLLHKKKRTDFHYSAHFCVHQHANCGVRACVCVKTCCASVCSLLFSLLPFLRDVTLSTLTIVRTSNLTIVAIDHQNLFGLSQSYSDFSPAQLSVYSAGFAAAVFFSLHLLKKNTPSVFNT